MPCGVVLRDASGSDVIEMDDSMTVRMQSALRNDAGTRVRTVGCRVNVSRLQRGVCVLYQELMSEQATSLPFWRLTHSSVL